MSWVIWLTGLPGSGKTTIARGVARALERHGIRAKVLGLEQLRPLLSPVTRAPEAEQELLHRVLAHAAALLSDAGVPVLVDAAAPRRAWRDRGRTLARHFAEVQLLCPPELCGSRERAARWSLAEASAVEAKRAVAPPAPEIVVAYEHSLMPDLILRTDVRDPWGAIEAVVRLALRLERAAAGGNREAKRRIS